MARIEEFITFCKVLEYKSFSHAAEMLGLTQPAISMQVKSLEEEYGSELLHRDGFEIVPTQSGEAVYKYACEIVDLFKYSKQQVRELDEKIEGDLVIGSSTGAGQYILPVIMGKFKKIYSNINVSLKISASEDIANQVLQHQLELGFVGFSRRDRYLRFESFIKDRLSLVVPPQHPWAVQRSVSLEEFLDAPLIVEQQGAGTMVSVYQALNKYGVSKNRLNIKMELGLMESNKAAVMAGYGVSLIPRLGVMKELDSKELVEITIEEVELPHDIYVVYKRMSALSILSRTFLKFAHNEVKTLL